MNMQLRLYGPMMHEMNCYLSAPVNLHQVQRAFEAFAYMHFGKAVRILGPQAFEVLKGILSNYQTDADDD